MLPRLTGPRLRRLRFIVLLLGTLTVVLHTVGAPLYFRDLAQGCVHTGCEYGLVVTPSAGDLAALGLTAPVYAFILTSIEVLHAWFFFAVAALLFWQAPNNKVALLGALFLLSWGATNSNPMYALAGAVPPLRVAVNLLAFLSSVSLFAFFSLFPSGEFVPRFMRYLLAAWAVIVLVVEFSPSGAVVSSNPVLLVVTLFVLLGAFVSLVVAQLYRYRKVSTYIQREQTKWVVYGISVSIAGFIIMLFLGAFYEPVGQAKVLWGLGYHLGLFGATLIIPLALVGAITRSRLWSIDLLIRRTLVYTALTAALLVLYFAAVVVLQALVGAFTGQDRSTFVTVLSTLAIAALFSPLRVWLQRAVDRRFYRRRYSIGQTLARFSATLRDDLELDGLSGRLVDVVDETMQPEHVSLWLKPVDEVEFSALRMNNR